MKMRIKNTSHWNSEDLRRLVKRGVKESGIDPKSLRTIIVETGRRKYGMIGYGGCAQRYYRYVKMRVPKATAPITFDKQQFCQVLMHELDQIRGLHHKEMIPITKIDVSWHEEYEISAKQPKPKVVRNIKQERYEHTLKLIKKNERKLKSTQTRLKSLYKRKQYYEKPS